MDPATTATALKVLAKAFSMGLAAYKARQHWGLNVEELSAIETLVGGTGELIGMIPSASGVTSTRLVALHTALVTRAFAIACHEHWAGSKAMAPGLDKSSWFSRQLMSKQESDRRTDIESRLRMALDSLAELEEGGHARAFEHISNLVTDPLASPYYGALWKAFTDPLLEDGEQANLIELQDAGARLEFERFFRLAYAELIAAPVGSELARGLLELESARPPFLRELIVRWVSSWKSRHVFGDTEAPGVPTMPLGEIYVEPDGVYEEKRRDNTPGPPRREPVRSLIHSLLCQHKVIIVRGDFGQGKSLTARTMASEWAESYVTEKEVRSSEIWYPLFVKCGEDFPNHEPTLALVTRRALQRQARSIKIDLPLDDGALDSPTGSGRVVYIIDGFDEVALTRNEIDEFFRTLNQSIGANGRSVVFSRKGVIPQSTELRGIPIVDLAPFRDVGARPGGQIAEWLERWNRLSGRTPIAVEQLRERFLVEIARTPILLFMAALTWDERRTNDAKVTRAEIYEKFFLQIASGKCRQDEDEHRPVAMAAGRLLAHLIERGELEKASSDASARDEQPRAMLWTLARMAWEMQCCAHRGEDLTLHEVTTILKEDLGIRNDPSALEVIKIGVLLVLQADQRGGNDRILFGHKSFREFLVARYWASRLKKLVAVRYDNRRAREKIEKQLVGARLLGDDDEGFVFLMEMINGPDWSERQRQALVEWAADTFNDERGCFDDKDTMSWRNDYRPNLREAALAIGSMTDGSSGIATDNEYTLRTLLGSFWVHDAGARIVGPRLDSVGARLNDANLAGAHLLCARLMRASLVQVNFTHANLEGANLEGANLMAAIIESAYLDGVNLKGANLIGAKLQRTRLDGADLEGANMEQSSLNYASLVNASLAGATLVGAYFVRAQLRGANLAGADLAMARFISSNLEDASMSRANLSDAVLSKADLSNANLEMADLRDAQLNYANLDGANLEGANLARANLKGANLKGANLKGANLKGANLKGANLKEADLAGATLREANLEGADMSGVRYDQRTTWPDGFGGQA